MLKFIVRLLLAGVAAFIFFTFGTSLFNTVRYRLSGTVVEGRVTGFLAGRNTPSVQTESTGVRKGKRRARRPVYRYPVSEASADSLTGKSNLATLFSFTQFDLNERVTIVFSPAKPEDSYIFSGQLLFTNLLVLLFGAFMFYMAWSGRG